MVRRDGNDVLFLNDLRFLADSALTLRHPLEKTDLPAVKAVLGQEGIVEGVDYRGVAVTEALRRVPDSPWFLVARMDTSEVVAPLHERLWLTIFFTSVLLLGSGAGDDSNLSGLSGSGHAKNGHKTGGSGHDLY